MSRPTLRKRAGLLLLRACGWLAVRGLRMAGAGSLLVETPEYARQRDAAEQRVREAFTRALVAPPTPGIAACPCPRCTQTRADASRWN
jgi:hypothetical protein